MSGKLVSAKRVLSNDECQALVKSVTSSTVDESCVVARLDKSMDQALYQMFFDAAKSCNPLKLSFSAIQSMSIFRYSSWNIGQLKSTWDTEKSDTKLEMFVPLSSRNEIVLSVNMGSSFERTILEDGLCYFWPAMAQYSMASDNPDNMFAISGKLIGKKLN